MRPVSIGHNGRVQISAKVDYGVRALVTLASSADPLTTDEIARRQEMPTRFLGAIMTDLRRAGLVSAQRGVSGGYRLTRPASEIKVAEVIRALDGPLAGVRGERPEHVAYGDPAAALRTVWVAARAALREVLDHVSLAEVASGELPDVVTARTADPAAWDPPR